MKEEWKVIEDYPDYEISNHGQIRRLTDSGTSKAGKIIKHTKNPAGYPMVGLTKNGKQHLITVHSLVATYFIGKRPYKYQCNHKNGIRDDFRIENLEWVTCSDNLKHSFRVLHRARGNGVRYASEHHNTKLDWEKVAEIKKLLGTKSMREIGRMFDVHWTTIRGIRDNKTWRYPPGTFNPRSKGKYQAQTGITLAKV